MVTRQSAHSKISAAGLLVTLGIIYGDLGTSPLYVMKPIIGNNLISSDLVLGGISCIFWTLTLQTTIKYVLLTLRADNKGEGGIFSLYALVRKTKVKWLIFPAIIGGSALLADGLITPSISVSSAVEGLRFLSPHIPTIPIVITIIFLLFFLQQFGTNFVGKSFGPIMLIWFSMISILGLNQIVDNVSVLKAVNPYYAIHLLTMYPGGFWILGAVFLCTTGAEALYSDLGHCGKKNVYATWGFVKLSLLINYFGQAAWLLKYEGQQLFNSPFYSIMPEWFLIFGIIIATLAAIVASQALISGSFTLINEAMRLNFGPKLKIVYPTDLRGQVYIPTVNWMLCLGCIGIVLHFKESAGMEGAYGLSIIIAMLMTTILLSYYLYIKRYPLLLILLVFSLFMVIEVSFLIANMSKFTHGGYVTLLIALLLSSTMFVWYEARKIRNRFVIFVKVQNILNTLTSLSHDESIPKYATNLVYLTSANRSDEIESKVIYSLLQKFPKRADIYWFVHVDVLDEPYTMEYKVEELVNDKVIRIDFRLGFRIDPRINMMFRQVVEELVNNKEVDIISRYASLKEKNVIGDFRFVVIEKLLSYDNDLGFYDKFVLNVYDLLKIFSLPESKAFGLDTSFVTVETVPLVVKPTGKLKLKRI
ncbi:MAG TPA: KUP/HAK/KT family potassium transporter [Bacteroidia bacterium]|nr:MAG: potassium transporter [Bacteroidetes bacterium OLB10]MBV6453499.1 Low affinity potassium transport system protein kup [Bacteroidia bacterium]MBX3107269.1 KUP/HAK/KT family potassium transporter [Bacteroidota bacterium]MCB0849769.1 KUP/HAK/KT family potassium transporter [Bacteroidota bacterium]MCO5288359.1 KUP/HAK/KT family potassium transporter [Bacteroidota bacterium]